MQRKPFWREGLITVEVVSEGEMIGKGSDFYNGVKLVTVNHKAENLEAHDMVFGVYLTEGQHDTVLYVGGGSGVYCKHIPGQITFAPPISDMKVEFPSLKAAHTRVELPPKIIMMAANDNNKDKIDVRRGINDDSMAGLIRAFKDAGPSPDPLFVDHLTMAISYRAASWFGAQEPANDNYVGRINRAIEYMNDNIAKPVTISELASVACMSEFHFARQFKRTTGRPPHGYMLEKRIDMAKRLLANAVSIAVVALACGFSSQSHLSTKFKARVGVSPAHYQRQIRT